MNKNKIYVDSDGWVHCPFCSCKSRTKIRRDTVLKNFPLFCPKCGHETVIDYNTNLQLEPDAQTQSE